MSNGKFRAYRRSNGNIPDRAVEYDTYEEAQADVDARNAINMARMKLSDKLQYLQDNHFGEWLKARQEAENELSAKQSMFCVCGRLATGLHENGCRKFRNLIEKEAVKKLEHLLTVEAQ